ncbi:MAG: flagellar hook-associated protein FlgL [Gemmatimonadaceae bacterium]
MRITNNMVSRNSLISLQRSLKAMNEAQNRATNGLRVEKPSDDPSAATSIMASGSSIRAIDQYKRNISSASARLDREESILGSVTQIMERAKELGLQQGSSTADAQTRNTAKAEIDQLIQTVVQLGNTQHEGEYLFGGDQSNTAPFTSNAPPFSTTPPTGTRRTEISSALSVRTNHNGTEVFLTTGVLASLDQLSTALGTNNQSAIQASLSQLDSAHSSLQVLIGETGAAANQLEVATSNLDALDTSLRSFKSKLQDADIETAVSELVGRQTAYQAAMLATSRVMSLNLADYLR